MGFLAKILIIAFVLRPYHCSPTPGHLEGGYTLPRDLSDGVHYVPIISHTDSSGTLTPRYGDAVQIANTTDSLHRLGNTGTSTDTNIKGTVSASAPSHLPINRHRCKMGEMLDSGHYHMAFTALAQRCDEGEKIFPHSIMFAKYGSALVYGCSFAGKNPCSSHELELFEEYLDKNCGPGIVGYAEMKHWKKRYGRADFESKLCHINLSQ
ncbi:hypothetical protein HD806DRAFT_373806 [Xylariaceae sp. AK1471]|nr:hypothetical protein HD806DRAFT_373806 [Xylariaceae sp. AK1471]